MWPLPKNPRDDARPSGEAWLKLRRATRTAPFFAGKTLVKTGVDWVCLRASHLRWVAVSVMLLNASALLGWLYAPWIRASITFDDSIIAPSLIGVALIGAAIAGLTSPRSIFWRASDRELTVNYGPFIWRRRLRLEREGLSTSLRLATDTETRHAAPLPPALLLHNQHIGESVRLCEAENVADLRPAFDALSDFLGGAQDNTQATVEIDDNFWANLSREPVAHWPLGGSDAERFVESDERLIARPSPTGGMIGLMLLVMGGVCLAGAWFPLDGTWTTRLLALAVAGLFVALAVFLFVGRPTTIIDRRRELVAISRLFPRRRLVIPWSEIGGVQLCRRAGRDDESPSWKYELNLVMRGHSASRVQVLSAGTPVEVRQAGDQVGQFMGRPVWDHMDEG